MSLPSVSANSIITDALQKIGIYAPGETLTDADASIGLTELNDLLDDWLADSIFMYKTVNVTANIFQETQDYTVGPGGMINIPRPIRVVLGRGVATVSIPPSATATTVDSVSKLEWQAIYNPANNATIPFLAIPAAMYYEPQYPFGLLSISPLPSGNGQLTFPALYAMQNFTDLTTSYAMAPAQDRALKANLAIVLNPYFGGSPITPELLAEAQQAKTTLTLLNRMSRAMSHRNREPPARGTVPRQ